MALELYVAFDNSLKERSQVESAAQKLLWLFQNIASQNLAVGVKVTFIWATKTETLEVPSGKMLAPLEVDLATARVSTAQVVSEVAKHLKSNAQTIGDKYVLIFGEEHFKLEPSAKDLDQQIEQINLRDQCHFIAIGENIVKPRLQKTSLVFVNDSNEQNLIVREIVGSVAAAEFATKRFERFDVAQQTMFEKSEEAVGPVSAAADSNTDNPDGLIEPSANNLELGVELNKKPLEPNAHSLRAATPPSAPQVKPEQEESAAVAQRIVHVNLSHRLPNQTAGIEFEIKIDQLVGHELAKEWGLPKGLTYSQENCLLSGAVQEATDAVWHVASYAEGKFYFHDFNLEVNPDPRTLWKLLPSDSSAKFHKVDSDFKIVSHGNILMAGGSVRGRSHENAGLHRDDDFAIVEETKNGWSIFAIADGAGSSQFSRRGSEIAVEVAPRTLASLLDAELEALIARHDGIGEIDLNENLEMRNKMYSVFVASAFETAKSISAEADVHKLNVSDFYSTLILVAIKRIESNWIIGSFSIGDGAATVLWDSGAKVSALSKSDEGEFAGQTKFLTTDQFATENAPWNRLHLVKIPSFDAIALMTDGVSDPKIERKDSNSAIRWKAFLIDDWAQAVVTKGAEGVRSDARDDATESRFKDWLGFWAKGSHDDRTLVVVMPKDSNGD